MKKILSVLTILWVNIGCETKKDSKGEVALPPFTTLSAVDLYTGKGESGDVLIPSATRTQKSSDREKTLRGIMRSEGWLIISAFSTKEAYEDRSCAPFPERTEAFNVGYLGKVDENGKFSE